MRLSLGFFALLFLYWPAPVSAEPWLSNRYAQNCAACHAPGRINRPMTDRACTLNCQGCHVNPNGGGLRNFYGKYNQDRWLHSKTTPKWKQGGPPPAPYQQQPYYDKIIEKYLKSAPPKARNSAARKLVTEGAKTKYLAHGQAIPEERYDREFAADEHDIEPSEARFLMRVPKDDPYRQRRENVLLAGGDFRYFFLSNQVDDEDAETYTFPMTADIGVRYMPVDGYSLVTEARFLNYPQFEQWSDQFTTEAMVRSAYLLADGIPYNTYAMYGLYRPMFGHYNPDHTTLFSRMTGLNQRTVLSSVSLGTAPNVPFINVHYFTPITTRPAMSEEEGYAINLGARFVSYGASMMFSYWDSTNERIGRDKKMMSLTGGGALGNWVGNFDFTTVDHETEERRDKGAVTTLEFKYRIFRENYLQANYATSNTALSLREGSATQMGYGVKSFLLPGTEIEFLATQTEEEPEDGEKRSTQNYLLQLHLFF